MSNSRTWKEFHREAPKKNQIYHFYAYSSINNVYMLSVSLTSSLMCMWWEIWFHRALSYDLSPWIGGTNINMGISFSLSNTNIYLSHTALYVYIFISYTIYICLYTHSLISLNSPTKFSLFCTFEWEALFFLQFH